TYFELEDADEEAARNWRGERASGDDADPDKTAGFRTHGKSKDSRDDLPQIVIGMAVTRQAIPVRVWCWPGNTADSALIRQVKEVRISDTDRFVICHNPDAAVRDAAIRDKLVAHLEQTIAGSDQLSATKRAELRGKISMMPGLNRFLRLTPGGLLRADKAKIK